MNDGGDDGDVDGDECWSNVKCPQFDIFSKGGLLQGWRFAREVVFSHPEVFAHTLLLRTEMFKHKKMCTDTFPDRNVYAQKFVHTHTNVYPQNFLHTEHFTHISFYTHNFLRT